MDAAAAGPRRGGDAAANPPDDPADGSAGELIRVGPIAVHFLVTGNDSNGSLALFEVTVPAGERIPAPPHSHTSYEETIYGLAGVLTWFVDKRRVDVAPGQALCIRRGAVHRFANDGNVNARVLIAASPAGVGPAYFREVAAVLAAADAGPPDRARMLDVLRRHGFTPAPPSA